MYLIFDVSTGCKSIEVLKLSQVKVSDKGVGHLLHLPLESLRELDLSHTLITSRSLERLPQGMYVCVCVWGGGVGGCWGGGWECVEEGKEEMRREV